MSVEMTVNSMQRQLLEIADRIPNDILLNLLKSFAQILTRDPEPAPRTPFIRAFAKIRDDNSQKQFSAIIEEDEDNHVIPHEENLYLCRSIDRNDIHGGDRNEGENECSFNYKVSNVVTQEVIYSMNGNEHNDDQQQQQESTSAGIVDDYNNNNKDETNGDQMSDNRADNETMIMDESLLNENHDAIIENGRGIGENGNDAIDEGIEVEMPKLVEPQDGSDVAENCEEVEKKFNEISQEAGDDRDEMYNNAENGEIMGESQMPLDNDDNEVDPIQNVTLDDIQREIQEMQMFLKHKNAQEESVVNHEIRNSKKIEDSFKVDVCLNLKKKREDKKDDSHHRHHHHHKKHSKSKTILANYLNGAAKEYLPKPIPIFDPDVPNTPEDFMKEKCVTEKINKKKQKIKNLDVNWQRLVDSQKKVYK